MRNSLDELPVLLCMLWGGVIAGLASSLLRMPGRAYYAALRGRRARLLPKACAAALDIMAAAAIMAAFSLSLIHANGGEPRLYAVCGFAAGCALSGGALRMITGIN